MRNRWIWILIGLCLTNGSGCTAVADLHYAFVNAWRTSSAWRQYGKPCSTESVYKRDFERGWKAGYSDILHGGPGIQPSVAPVRYMHTKYQNPSGRRSIETWYRGFTSGTIVAEQRNVGQWNDAPGMPPKAQMPGFFAPDMPIPPRVPMTPLMPSIPDAAPGALPMPMPVPSQETLPTAPAPPVPLPTSAIQRLPATPRTAGSSAGGDVLARSLAASLPPRP